MARYVRFGSLKVETRLRAEIGRSVLPEVGQPISHSAKIGNRPHFCFVREVNARHSMRREI